MTESSTWSNSDTYEAIMGRWSRPAASAALAWLDMPAGLRWLDVGCGTGALTEAIRDEADPLAIQGIEPSREFLERASERVRSDRVQFAVGSAESLPVLDDYYDVVLSGLVLHFVADPLRAVVEMTRATRPGGTVASHIWAVSSADQFTRPFWQAAIELDPASTQWDPLRTHGLNAPERLAEVFSAAPLAAVSVSEIAFPVVFRDYDDYWQPCLLDGPTPIQRYTRSLSDERHRALGSRLRELLPTAPDGSIHLLGRLWIARGTSVA